jgi:hypothetical protein
VILSPSHLHSSSPFDFFFFLEKKKRNCLELIVQKINK